MIVMVIVIIAYLFTVQIFSYLYNNLVYENLEHILSVISDRVEQDIATKREITTKVAVDAFVLENMEALKQNSMNYSKIKIISELKNLISAYTATASNLVGSLLIDNNAITQVRTGEFDFPPEVGPEDMLREAGKNNGGTKMLYFKTAPNKVYICCKLGDDGFYFMEVDMSSLLYFTANVSENCMFELVISNQGYPVYCDKKMENFNMEKFIPEQGNNKYSFTEYNDNRYMTLVRQHSATGWEYIILEDYNMIFKGLNRFNIVFYLILALVLISTNAIYVLLTKKTTLSLEAFAKKMRQSTGEFVNDTVKENKVNDEILVMSEDLDRLVSQMQKMIQEDYSKQLTIKETEYKMLQMQITPHFLYNTLQSVSVMAKMGLADKIPNVIKKLSNLLRTSLDTEYILHTVGEEIEILHDYVDIQIERFGERLNFIVDNSVYELEEYLIPKMTLQPLVENCIRHILEKIPGQCVIELKAEIIDAAAKIIILDNGYGISASRAKSVLEGTFVSKHNSIGLYNVNKRLKYYFGDEYGIKMYNRPQGGMCMEVLIKKSYDVRERDADEEGINR